MSLETEWSSTIPYSASGASGVLGTYITVVKISPDGTHVAIGLVSPYVFSVTWSQLLEHGSEFSWHKIKAQLYQGHVAGINCINWSPEGDKLVSGSDDMRAVVWNLNSPVPELVMRGHRQPITSAAFVPGSRTIVTSSLDRSLCFWSRYSGILLFEHTSHLNGVTMMDVDYSGTVLATGSLDGLTRVMSIEDEALVGTYSRSDESLTNPVIGTGLTPNGEYAWSIHVDGWVEMYAIRSKTLVLAVRVELWAPAARYARFIGNAMLVSTGYGIAVIDVMRGALVEKEYFEGGITSFDAWYPGDGFGDDAEQLKLCLVHNDTIYIRFFSDLSAETQHAIKRTSVDEP